LHVTANVADGPGKLARQMNLPARRPGRVTDQQDNRAAEQRAEQPLQGQVPAGHPPDPRHIRGALVHHGAHQAAHGYQQADRALTRRDRHRERHADGAPGSDHVCPRHRRPAKPHDLRQPVRHDSLAQPGSPPRPGHTIFLPDSPVAESGQAEGQIQG
jgi:hypothetical protein